MIKFVADSSSDCPRFADVETQYPPLTISTEERSFTDDEHLDISEMLTALENHKGRSFTACPSVDAWLQAYETGDEIYAATITSSLSGSYNAAMAARELCLQEHPEKKIAVFDTLSTGPEIVLLLEKIKSLKDQGIPFDQVVVQAKEYLKKTRLFFCLQSLHNLSQNGRVSKVAAAAVGVLGIRIVGTASPEGVLALLSKCRGDRKALPEIVSQMDKAGFTGGKVRITHALNLPLAEKLAEMITASWPQADIAISPCGGLCSYYAERGGLLIGIETT